MIFGGQFGLGIGQGYQDIVRLVSVTYTNTTGKPILIKLNLSCTTAVLLASGQVRLYSFFGASLLASSPTNRSLDEIFKAWSVGEVVVLNAIVPNLWSYTMPTLPVGITATFRELS